jgi:virginiamycin B lyase
MCAMHNNRFAWLLGLAALLAGAPAAQAREDAAPAGAARIQEWTVPWPDTRPRDPYVAPDGRIWFVGQAGNYLAVFDPDTASFDRHDLPEGTRPHTVVVDGQGRPWIAGNGNGTILRFDPDSGRFTTYAVPETEGIGRRDPHTFAFDGRGGIWFTLQRGNGIGRIDMASGRMRLVPVKTANALPYGILATADGRPWAVLLGTNKLATVDPESFEVTEIDLPRADARPRRLAITADGKVWYGDYAKGQVGAYDPATGRFREWAAPSERSGPYAFGSDARGRIWFVETIPQPNLLQGFDPASGEYLVASPIPSGGGSVRHMMFDPQRNSLWFGTDSNTLARAKLPD